MFCPKPEYGRIKRGEKMFNQIWEILKNARHIYLYRHINADYDALGAQYGLWALLKNLAPVSILGTEPEDLKAQMKLPEVSRQEPEGSQGEVAVVLDTANQARIDGQGFKRCETLIKIDHHEIVDEFGDFRVEKPEAGSTCEIITAMAEILGLNITAPAAAFLYFGMIGDTGRFLYAQTSPLTLRMAARLLETGIDISQIYEAMYLRDRHTLASERYVLNHTRYANGVAYFILEEEELEQLNLTREQASRMVDLLGNVREYHVWAAVTYQKESGKYRVSLRSRHVDVAKVAASFQGGGHRLASGATLNSLNELPLLIAKLEEAVKNEISI